VRSDRPWHPRAFWRGVDEADERGPEAPSAEIAPRGWLAHDRRACAGRNLRHRPGRFERIEGWMRAKLDNCSSMIKAKMGDAVLAKSDVGKMNEAVCKVLAHNICCVISAIHELGIEPTFGQRALPA
jgi:hypothetical protein